MLDLNKYKVRFKFKKNIIHTSYEDTEMTSKLQYGELHASV